MELMEKLRRLRQNEPYPMHMPGHKRIRLPFPDVYDIDITEVEGYDNLHHPTGIIRQLASETAGLYGADEAYLSVGGSTDMNLAAFFAATKVGDKVLIARNCHKSIYHAAILRNVSARYIYPEITRYGIPGEITSSQVAEALDHERNISTCVITSPTYEGVISDVRSIAEVCHRRGVSLIVDCAHGAHLGFGDFYENPISQGADAVVVSLHKTLPSLTQTACLLRNNDSLIPSDRIRKYFDYFETSSPSYILMAGIDSCVTFLTEHGREKFLEYRTRLQNLRKKIQELDGIDIFSTYRYDESKIVLHVAGMSGPEAGQRLRQGGIEPEMESLSYIICMTSVMDTEEGFSRLYSVLKEISTESDPDGKNIIKGMYPEYPRRQDEIGIAESEAVEFIEPENASGLECGGIITVYPPGIPLIVPGEIYTRTIVEKLKNAADNGLEVEGLSDGRFPVIRK